MKEILWLCSNYDYREELALDRSRPKAEVDTVWMSSTDIRYDLKPQYISSPQGNFSSHSFHSHHRGGNYTLSQTGRIRLDRPAPIRG